jgi:hypothetical protein
MDLVDDKYINYMSSRLEKFKKVKPGLYNCRCVICGDSSRSKSKARGYFYSVRNTTNYKCHNCGASMSLNNFMKTFDAELHQRFCLEKFKMGFTGKNFPVEEPKFDFKKPKFKQKIDLPKTSEHELISKYLRSRKLNPDRFFYAENFKSWVNSIKETFDEEALKHEEPRIVIPLYFDKELIGIQGRALRNSSFKYITIMFDESQQKVYGYDDVDTEKSVYILEGPFDSEFIENSIAMCGADINLEKLNIKDPIYVYDNEPRNKEIHSRMNKKIDEGHSIVMWPSDISYKDVNIMVTNNLNVMSIIKSNTYKGLLAKLKFNEWIKKV